MTAAAAAASRESKAGALFRAFNTRLQEMFSDLSVGYGSQFSRLNDAKKDLTTYLRMDGARRTLAEGAWPLFHKHRRLIETRDTQAVLKHDLAGLKSRYNVPVTEFWSAISPEDRDMVWVGIENLLDALDDINAAAPFPPLPREDLEDDTHSSGGAAAGAAAGAGSGAAGGEKKSERRRVATWWASLDEATAAARASGQLPEDADGQSGGEDDDGEDDDDGTGEGKGGEEGAKEWTKSLMSSMRDMIGGEDSEVSADFEELMGKMGEAEDAKTTPKDSELMTRVMGHFINRLAPTDDVDEEDLQGLDLKERESEIARREMEAIRRKNQIKVALGRLTSIESLQQTSDPGILENEKKEAAEEEERRKHPEKTREFTITAHFNHKLLQVLLKLQKARGEVKLKSDGSIAFPQIMQAIVELVAKFDKNRGAMDVIRPIGKWVADNRARLQSRDDNLFLEPENDFLKSFQSRRLWLSFKEPERINFWNLIGHPMQLATIFHRLDNESLSDIAEIVNDLLHAGGIAYDRDPSTLRSKDVISKAIERGCTPHKIAKIRGLFDRMQKEPDQRTIKSLTQLMQDVLPAAARAKNSRGPVGASSTSANASSVAARAAAGLDAAGLEAERLSREGAEKMQAAMLEVIAKMKAAPKNDSKTKPKG
jgi:hypothetical protein